MDFTINGLVYRTVGDENNEVTLYRTEGLKRPVRNIPAEVEHDGNKYKVTTITGRGYNGGAFQGDTTLSNFSLPETIIEIKGSYHCDYGAFYGCSSLKEINFPNSFYILKLLL